MKHKTIAAAALVTLLAACDSGSDGAADGRTAEGEVLGGTISDEMLPLDTVRSQSPPLVEAEEGGEDPSGADSTDEPAVAEPPTDEPAPQAEPIEPEAEVDE